MATFDTAAAAGLLKVTYGRRRAMPEGRRYSAPKRLPTRAKAGEMLRHGERGGKPLTRKQKGLFGAIRGGQKITRLKVKGRQLRRR